LTCPKEKLIFGKCNCQTLKEHHLEVLKDVTTMIQHGENARAIVEISKEISDSLNGRFD